MARGYWFLYRDRDNSRGCFYDWNEANLKYVLDASEAKQWYEQHRNMFVTVHIKRPPDIEVPISIPLGTKEIKKNEVDTRFFEYITKWHISTRAEMVLNKFMDNYYLWQDWLSYRRDKKDELAWSWKNTMALIMMKDIILGKFRVTPFMLPEQKRTTGTAVATKYIPWDYWSDFNITYTVQWEEYSTNLFWVYTPKLYDIMLPNSDFEGRRLQKWQMMVQLLSGRVNYIIWPRSGWKSLIMTWESAAYLLKETTSEAERLQEFAVLYMGLSVKQNAPYINYSKQMLNNLFKDWVNIVRREDDVLYLLDWDKKRSLEFITTGQADPARSRRTMFAVADEADYLDWNKVKTLIGTPGSIVNLISTIDPKTQAWEFYKWWKRAYERQRDYEPIDVLIHRIWTEHNMHLCKSRDDIIKKINNWEFAEMRSEFLQARPEVAMHFTIDDLEFLTEAEKQAQNEASMAIWWYEYMLAENYGEYATNDNVFNIDWLQWEAPINATYAVLWYDEAENYDDPALAVVMVDKSWFYCAQAEKLPKDPWERFQRMRDVAAEFKRRCKQVFIAADISRSEAIAREMAMLWLPVDMQIRWWGNSDYKPERGKWLVNKQWCVGMINDIFMNTHQFKIDPKCYNEWWLVEQIGKFKRRGKTKIQAEGSWHDDQVSALMASLFYVYNREQLWLKAKVQWQRALSANEMRERAWVEKYQREKSPEEQRKDSLALLKQNLF